MDGKSEEVKPWNPLGQLAEERHLIAYGATQCMPADQQAIALAATKLFNCDGDFWNNGLHWTVTIPVEGIRALCMLTLQAERVMLLAGYYPDRELLCVLEQGGREEMVSRIAVRSSGEPVLHIDMASWDSEESAVESLRNAVFHAARQSLKSHDSLRG